MHTLNDLEYLLAIMSTSIIMLLCIGGCLYSIYYVYKLYYTKRVVAERRLLLIESKLKKLGQRIHIPDWEQLDD